MASGFFHRKIEEKYSEKKSLAVLFTSFLLHLLLSNLKIERLCSLKEPCLFGGTGIPPIFILSSLEANH